MIKLRSITSGAVYQAIAVGTTDRIEKSIVNTLLDLQQDDLTDGYFIVLDGNMMYISEETVETLFEIEDEQKQNDTKIAGISRKEVLDMAAKCVLGDREQDYGSPESNFGYIAKLWSIYLEKEVTPLDVSVLMILMKIARIKNGGGTGDSFVDIAGYAACGGEILGQPGRDIK